MKTETNNQQIDSLSNWSPDSWRNKIAQQQPEYPCQKSLDIELSKIKTYPPLVFGGEVNALKKQLAEAGEGKRFILQGGDCAERFQDCTAQNVERKLKILLQMSVVLCYGSRKPIIRVGRIAGQYAKPRSSSMESVMH